MDRRTYVEQVLANLRRVTPGERAAIRDEIDGHIEDHICDLLELGYDEKLAEERAMSFMGDPVEVGRERDKQYPPAVAGLYEGRYGFIGDVLSGGRDFSAGTAASVFESSGPTGAKICLPSLGGPHGGRCGHPYGDRF